MSERRFKELTPETMTPEQKKVADAIQSGPRGAGLRGPFNALLRSPVPRGPAWIASAAFFCSGVMVSGVSSLKRRSAITYLLHHGEARISPPSTMISVPVI